MTDKEMERCIDELHACRHENLMLMTQVTNLKKQLEEARSRCYEATEQCWKLQERLFRYISNTTSPL